jgi:ribosomal protein S18 acetylase RimI-like enzyme
MSIEIAGKEIMPAWEDLAREVESLFEKRMAGQKDFRAFMARKIAQREAFIVRDYEITGKLLGLIAISHKNNAVSWFAVSKKHRGQGIGEMLLAYALNDMDKTRVITVITFKENQKEGLPARRLYQKFGFKDDIKDFVHDGLHRCLMKCPPQRE